MLFFHRIFGLAFVNLEEMEEVNAGAVSVAKPPVQEKRQEGDIDVSMRNIDRWVAK